MIRRSVDFALRNRLFVMAITLLLVVAGGVAFHLLPVDAYPDVANNYVEVLAQWPGISAEQIEQQVTVPMEIIMAGMPGIISLRSFSLFGLSDVQLVFEDGTSSGHTVSLAAGMAAAVNAALTLVHITASVEIFGPGGSHVDPEWKERIVGFAAQEIAKLQQDVGTKAAVIIDSGNVLELLNRAAERTNADVLVIGHIPGRSHLGDNGNGYGIIRASQIPVLSV